MRFLWGRRSGDCDASQALMARLYVPSAQDMALVEQAEALVAAFVKQVDEFYDKEVLCGKDVPVFFVGTTSKEIESQR